MVLVVNVSVVQVVARLADALDRPLNGPGSADLARSVLRCFNDIDVLGMFAEKAVETLSDAQPHSRMAISPDCPRAAVQFVAWYGTPREVQAERYGSYLGQLTSMAFRLAEQRIELAGYLEIDAFLRMDTAGLDVDVELSFLPGGLLGLSETVPNPLPGVILIVGDLCTPEEYQLVQRMA